MSDFAAVFAAQRERNLDELSQFLAIPSISALSEHRADIGAAADWLCAALERAGMEHVTRHETAGNPVVVADHLHAPGKPTLLIYGHYDVQPVDPLNLWTTPPFTPTIRDGRIFARGASDDKGQVFLHIKAIETILRDRGALPLNVKFCIEGEEEVGSRSLTDFVESHAALLAADVLVVSDTPILGPMRPALTYGLRGLAALEFTLRTARSDLHSGLFGGAVPNALHALAELIASLHDTDGHVAVNGFYDDVQPLSQEERTALAALPHDDDDYRAALGMTALHGEPGYSTIERVMARPTLEVNGMWGGFQGEGGKTVIPAVAHAKITCRLVNNQDPHRILQQVADHLQAHAPVGATLDIHLDHGARPFVMPIDAPVIQAAADAYEAGYAVKPYFMRMGGSIPIVEVFQRSLGIPALLMGFGLPDENFHAPDEHFTLENFDRGLLTLAHLYTHLERV